MTLEALWQESEAEAQKPKAPIHPQIFDDTPLADEVEDIKGDIVLPDETEGEIETAAGDSPTRWIDDENIDAPDFDEWRALLAYRTCGSLPESECAEHHAPRGGE